MKRNIISKNKLQQGFTLIELMIVVAIIGILAAIAIPAYQNYLARAQASEAFTSVDGLKTTIAEFGQNQGAYPGAATKPTAASLTVTGQYGSAAVTADTGVIIYTFNATGVNANLQGKTITFTPPALNTSPSTFTWTCTSTAAQQYLPSTCTGT